MIKHQGGKADEGIRKISMIIGVHVGKGHDKPDGRKVLIDHREQHRDRKHFSLPMMPR